MAAHSFAELDARMEELKDLSGIAGILSWDQETYMPPKGAEPRAHHLATIQGLYHERLTAPSLGELIESAEPTHLTIEQAAMLRNLRWERERAVKVPGSLVKEIARRQSFSVEAWREARTRNDYATFRPHLEALTRLKREQADAWGHDGERYDALLEGFEPGMRVERLAPLLEEVRSGLVPLVRAIADSGKKPKNPLAGRSFDTARQWDFTLRVMKDMGFDFEAGRQDRSTHPFTGGGNHPFDVRLTTRLFADNPISGVMSSIHECGHGLYEQGFDPAHARTYLAQVPSLGLHESQSRFWENLIGRSKPFWQHYLPILQASFPSELGSVDLEALYAWINHVEPSLIRVEADEVTYNLHILVRFELELDLMRDALQAADLPEAWRAKMKELLGVEPRDDTEGVMQDIHWALGELGYFPTYTLGNLVSAMLLARLEREVPSVWNAVAQGELNVVLDWLRAKIHRQGFLYPAEDLVERVTGSRLCAVPFLRHLHSKYGPLYGVA